MAIFLMDWLTGDTSQLYCHRSAELEPAAIDALNSDLPSPDMSHERSQMEAERFLRRSERMTPFDRERYLASMLQRIYCEAFIAGFDRAAMIAKRHSR